MLVFDDTARIIEPRNALRDLALRLRDTGLLAPGVTTHAKRVGIFIDAAELAQGIADAHFTACGVDAPSADVAGMSLLLMQLGALVQESWENSFGVSSDRLIESAKALEALSCILLPACVECKRSEGYAFYALYPESYLEAGKSLRDHNPKVIGIRSIGIGLAALVAASAKAKLPVSLRPVGHPFHRELRLSPDFMSALSQPTQSYAIVDEGPGLSGSSFSAVLDLLEARGIARQRLHVFPSHAGDLGLKAGPGERERWRSIAKHHVSFDDMLLTEASGEQRLAAWVGDLTGPLNAPVEDLSGGAWRRLNFSNESAWPPSYGFQERRKFLLRSGKGRWLLKFAGLGRYGEAKLPIAKTLHSRGFTPKVLGLRYGFLVQRWADARPLDYGSLPRESLLAQIGRYLGFRAAKFPARQGSGASLSQLAAMLKYNAAELSGSTGHTLDHYCYISTKLQPHVRRIITDNRLQAWEWLVTSDGALLKTDALDHAQSHDLIGCQDVAWDVAGAIVEFVLDQCEADELMQRVAYHCGEVVSRDLLAFLLPCYSAFQLGLAHIVQSSFEPSHADYKRLVAVSERYSFGLKQQLSRCL